MYSSIRINGYRGLDSFRLEGLGRINLLVGTNNCGKTSILECIELLRSSGMNPVLSSLLRRHREWEYSAGRDRYIELDVTQMFTNHELHREISIEADRINAANSSGLNNRVTISVGDRINTLQLEDVDFAHEDIALRIDWLDGGKEPDTKSEPINFDGVLRLSSKRRDYLRDELGKVGRFIGTNGMSKKEVVRSLGWVVLTEDEEHVMQALRIIEPKIERIAPAVSEPSNSVFLKLRGIEERIPIGSVGDGMWRMLGLALAISTAKGGVLLVDEIDTGLHYSVMRDMWRMISQRADALDVQVFATTHSRDCYESLAAIAEPDSSPCPVTIQRIDRNHGQAVRFSNDEIVVAAERGIEVR